MKNALTLLAALALLAACGGGGGGGAGSTTYTVGGTVTGLMGSGLTIRNNTTDLAIATNGPFTFSTALTNGATYSVTVVTQPGMPAQVCTVENGTGMVNSGNVNNVSISCPPPPLSLSGSTPATGATAVQRTVAPELNFSAFLDATTATTGTVTLTGPTGNQTITVGVTGKQLKVIPTGDLSPLTAYTLTIGVGLRGSAGEQLAGPVTLSFTTDRGWGTAGPIGTANMGAVSDLQPQIAFDANGNALAVWEQSDGIHLSIWSNRYTAGGGWGNPESINPGATEDAFSPQLAFDKNGNALVVWYQGSGDVGAQRHVWSNRYTAAAAIWAGAQQIENNMGGASNPRIAIDAHGNALAVWQQFDTTHSRNSIWSNLYTVAGGWDQTQAKLISIDDVGNAGDPRIVIDADGNALAVWVSSGIRSNRYTAAVGWGATSELISTGGASGEVFPQVAVDADGNALAVWYQFDGVHSILWSNRYTAGGGWSTAAPIRSGATGDLYPQLAVDVHGNALAVWNESDGQYFSIWSQRYTAGSGWGMAEPIETNAGDAFNPQVAFDADGNALAVWTQFGSHEYIWSNRYRAGIGWDTAALIQPDSADRGTGAQIAIDAHGNALAVWQAQQADGTHARVWSNRFE